MVNNLQKIELKNKISYNEILQIEENLFTAIRSNKSVLIIVKGGYPNSLCRALIRKTLTYKNVTIDDEMKKNIYFDTEEKTSSSQKQKESILDTIGTTVINGWNKIYLFFVIMVDMIFYSFQTIFNRKFIMKNDISRNLYYIGYKAINIVFLLAFLIGFTITVQAALQMVKFGGQGYLATLIGLAMLKELGPLITAIIISGRTGSSIAAEIGTMVVMEEVDALQTMGIKPLKFILAPKFWAFTFAMPILTLIADLAGITGGMLVATAYNVPADSFWESILESLTFSDILWGTLKSLAFAWTILAVASYKGLNVRGGSDAVGRATTESVVVSIFLVVAIDALFSILLYT